MENIKKFSREYGHGRANYINGPRVAGARSLPASSQAYKLSNQPTQAASPQAKGSSFKPEATSSRIREPGYKRTSLGSGAQATRINVFKLCFM